MPRALWAYAAAVAAAGAVVALVASTRLGPPPSEVLVPWPLLAGLFCLAEIWVVHLHFRRDSISIALGEVPLVIGLFTMPVGQLILAQCAGAALALVLHRRQAPLKLLFNIGQLVLEAGLAALVFHALIGVGPSAVPRGWTAAVIAMAMESGLACVFVAVAVSLARGPEQLHRLPRVVAFGVATGIVNTAVGLLAVRLLENDRTALVLLLVPTLFLVLGYRAYITERHRSQRAEFLNTTGRLLERSAGIEAAMHALLRQAREMFHCDIAQISVDATAEAAAFHIIEGAAPATAWPELSTAVRRLRSGAVRSVLLQHPADHVEGGAVAALTGEAGVNGYIVVADRHAAARALGADDCRLLETLAAQASIAIENDRLERALLDRAYHDALTGLANRLMFSERLELMLRRTSAPVRAAVIFLDLDDFKTVNDSLGHGAGDELLTAVGRRLRNCVRPGDIAARLGGDEFAILVEVRHGAVEAMSVAERVATALQEPFCIAGNTVAVRGSIGIVVSDDRARSAIDLLRDADIAMYSAKHRGLGGISVFEPSMQAAVAERHRLKEDLHRALEEGELEVVYQPVVRVADGEILGAEALVRWHHPQRGPVAPADFIPLAEEMGLIQPLGRRVLDAALRDLASWEDDAPGAMISVNVSAHQLEHQHFAWLVEALLEHHGIAPERLVLEITESIMVGASAIAAQETLRELRALGVRIALDDFGTGFSSLGALRDLPVDILKLAKPFVDPLDEGAQHVAFATAICRLAAILGLTVIAEGVETDRQLELLRRLGCDEAQGYHLSRPVPASRLRELLAERHLPVGSQLALAAPPVAATA